MTRLVDRRSPEAARYRKLYKGARWRKLRAAVLAATPCCRRCRDMGRVTAATVVHHVRAHKGDEALFFDRSNLEAVCKPCHDGPMQSDEARGFSRDVAADGWPTDPAHPANRGGSKSLTGLDAGPAGDRFCAQPRN